MPYLPKKINFKKACSALSLIFLIGIFLAAFSYYNYLKDSAVSNNSSLNNQVLKTFTEQDLKEFNGEDDNKPIYIGLNGKVYDVSAGREFYRTDGPYHYLAGKDSSIELNLFGPTIITNKYKPIGVLVK